MKKLLSLLSLVFLVSFASAQSVATVKGILIDTLNKQSLKDASIVVLAASDSSLEVFTLAKADGSFIINNAPFGEMLVQVKFQGYEPFSKKITFSAKNSNVDLGKIYLQTAANDLGNVTVTQSPVKMNKDTVEFTASAFKTKPNAVAEDLLKKIPGIQVDKDGSIKAQGETVQRVLVDGKRFFGDDPKMATRNLPPDIIDKIQVFDAASDQSAFTGFDDGNRVKTINITTRKDKRKGYFGRAALGAGANTDEALYDNNINISKFNGDQQITFTGQANNVNKQNFSVQDMLGSLGGGGFGGAIALVAFYQAMSKGSMTVIAPITAVIGLSVPVLAGVLQGERPSSLAWLGIAIAVVAVALVGDVLDRHDLPTSMSAIWMAVAAGFGFGMIFVCMGNASHEHGLWPLFGQRLVSVPTVALIALLQTKRIHVPKKAIGFAILAGVLDTSANGLYLAATSMGLMSLVSVIVALYPVSTVALAMKFDHERLHRSQAVGIVMAAGALVLVSI